MKTESKLIISELELEISRRGRRLYKALHDIATFRREHGHDMDIHPYSAIDAALADAIGATHPETIITHLRLAQKDTNERHAQWIQYAIDKLTPEPDLQPRCGGDVGGAQCVLGKGHEGICMIGPGKKFDDGGGRFHQCGIYAGGGIGRRCTKTAGHSGGHIFTGEHAEHHTDGQVGDYKGASPKYMSTAQQVLETKIYCADTGQEEPLKDALPRMSEDWIEEYDCQHMTVDLIDALKQLLPKEKE